MENTNLNLLLPEVSGKIVTIRKHAVIADADVALLYGVETRRINEAVKNNPDKFPSTYMFELTKSELRDLRSKNSTTNVSAKNRNTTNQTYGKKSEETINKVTVYNLIFPILYSHFKMQGQLFVDSIA